MTSVTRDAQGNTTNTGALEILAFVDENGAHQDSVVLTIEGQSRDLGDKELAQLTLDLKGANGEFTCSWKGAEEQVGTNGAHYTSNGNCVDKATGKTFDFSGTADIKS